MCIRDRRMCVVREWVTRCGRVCASLHSVILNDCRMSTRDVYSTVTRVEYPRTVSYSYRGCITFVCGMIATRNRNASRAWSWPEPGGTRWVWSGARPAGHRVAGCLARLAAMIAVYLRSPDGPATAVSDPIPYKPCPSGGGPTSKSTPLDPASSHLSLIHI